ncbi:MAG: hypothetical protein SPK72_01235, partial [Bacteroidales bacterium]|nr:hypothetical protein [Bacteroidales bacterium]
GNTFGARHWSDQKMIAPMLPRVSPVQQCLACGKYYLEYNQPYVEGDDWSSERGELTYRQWKEAYAQLQSDKRIKKDDLQIVRHQLIQAFNDEYYRGGDCAPAAEEAYFVNVIHEYIDACSWNKKNILFKAELYREAGDMDKCAETLSSISIDKLQDFEAKIYREIEDRMKKGDKIVFEIKA